MDIRELLVFAIQQGASDLHLLPGEPPAIRLHGDIRRAKTEPLAPQESHDMLYDIMNEKQRAAFEATRDLDFSFRLGDQGRFRVNVFIQERGMGAVFRTIPTKIPTLASLNLPPILKDLTEKDRGLVLVTGPTGSGKSTTLAAMIDAINEERAGNILTIEDPIEFVHTPKKCIVSQREVGPHTNSFSNALRGALREDPDVILVGEMRDLETISLALTAAETGHLVFGTLHSSSAPKTLDRIIDVFPAAQQDQVRTMVAESMLAIMSQRLFKKRGGGRVAALEILVGVPAVRNLIRENKLHQIPTIMQTGQKFGMITMEAAVRNLLTANLIAPEEARVVLGDAERAGPAPGPGAPGAARPVGGPGAGMPPRPPGPPPPRPAAPSAVGGLFRR